MPLSNAQYDMIMRKYTQKQFQNRYVQEQHKKEILQRIPRISEISAEMAALSLERARLLLDGSKASSAELKARMKDLSEERQVLLTANGYPADYLELHYTCPLCKDTGYIDDRKCNCFRKEEIALLYQDSNMESHLAEENFDLFDISYYNDDIISEKTGITSREAAMQAFQAAKEFVAAFHHTFENLCFYGDTGVGKSFLSHCIAHELLQQGDSVLYLTAFDLFHLLEENAFSRDTEAAKNAEHIFDSDLLIIDDLGTELTNAFVSSQLFLCINERILNKKSTIISTNLSLEKFAETYSERIFSRILSSYKLIHLFGQDIRILKQLTGGQN